VVMFDSDSAESPSQVQRPLRQIYSRWHSVVKLHAVVQRFSLMSHLSGAEQSLRSSQKSWQLTHELFPSKRVNFIQQRCEPYKQSLSDEHAEVQFAFRKLQRISNNTTMPSITAEATRVCIFLLLTLLFTLGAVAQFI